MTPVHGRPHHADPAPSINRLASLDLRAVFSEKQRQSFGSFYQAAGKSLVAAASSRAIAKSPGRISAFLIVTHVRGVVIAADHC